MLEGAIYTVDEVSDLLGIPRPTLYRYLREYAIPHLRRAGRISIPEDSFDRIREARDLHKEGLGTESVRRQLREGGVPDTGELDRRLDSLHETLESLRGDIKQRPTTTNEVALSPTLRTILARQSLLMSAMFNLTEMVEDLLIASGKPRKPLFEDVEARIREPVQRSLAPERRGIAGTITAVPGTIPETAGRPLPELPTGFGALARRRRRGALAILAALLVGLGLILALPALLDAGTTESAVPRATETADRPPGGLPKAGRDQEAASNGTTAQGSAAKSSGATTVSASGRGSEMPDVSGRNLEEAARTVYGAGLRVAAIRTEASQEEPETVIRTEPSAGAPVKRGAPVVLTMSGGPTGTPPGAQSASASPAN